MFRDHSKLGEEGREGGGMEGGREGGGKEGGEGKDEVYREGKISVQKEYLCNRFSCEFLEGLCQFRLIQSIIVRSICERDLKIHERVSDHNSLGCEQPSGLDVDQSLIV